MCCHFGLSVSLVEEMFCICMFVCLAGCLPIYSSSLWYYVCPQELPSVSVLFADIVGFTPICKKLRPMEVVRMLNQLFVAFDKLCEKHHVYKVSCT